MGSVPWYGVKRRLASGGATPDRSGASPGSVSVAFVVGLGLGGRGGHLLVLALHLAVLTLHLLAAFLAVMLALLVLRMVHPLMLGMVGVRVRRRSGLGRDGRGDDERNRANKRLHGRFSKAGCSRTEWFQNNLGGGVSVSGSVSGNAFPAFTSRGSSGRSSGSAVFASAAGSAAQVAHCMSILAGASAGFW